MLPFADSCSMAPDERRTAIAQILADGVLRLHARAAWTDDAPEPSALENLAKSVSSCLEVSDETVLTVHNG